MFSTSCPGCKSGLNAPDSLNGKKVQCKKCGEPFVARPGRAGADDEPPVGKARSRSKGSLTAGEPDEDTASTRRSSRRSDDGKVRSASLDGEEGEDARPTKRKKKPSGGQRKKKTRSPILLIAILAGVAIVVLGGAAAAAYFAFSDSKKTEPAAGGGEDRAARMAQHMPEEYSIFPYSARFPAKYREQKQVLKSPRGNVAANSLTSDAGDGTYVLIAAGIADHHNLTPTLAEQYLDDSVDLLTQHVPGSQVVDRKRGNHNGLPFRDVTLSKANGGQAFARLTIGRNSLFTHIVIPKTADIDRERVQCFFEGFRIH